MELWGQSATISGTVQDARQQVASFANVLVLQANDSILVQGQLTNEKGVFLLEKGKAGQYLLTISMIGYQKHYSTIKVDNEPITIGDITIEESSVVLNEAAIQAQRLLYEQKADRLVVNVQSSITAAGNSVVELLQKSPGVQVNKQNNTISLNGKSGVTVMINNKISRLPLDAVVQMLDGMSAANLGKVELITNPPAKNDAEGTAGIILFVMVENIDRGTNGT